MGVKFEGLNEFKAALQKKAKVESLASTVVQYHGAKLQQNAQKNAPVDTGTLKRSITLDIKDGGLTAEVTAQASYSPYVEWGTRFMQAQPFMKPAYVQEEPKFIEDLKKVLEG